METYEVGSEMVRESPSPNSESHSADLPFKNIPNLDPLLTSSEYNHCGARRSVTRSPHPASCQGTEWEGHFTLRQGACVLDTA